MWIRSQDKNILIDVKTVQTIASQEGIKIVDGHDHFFTLGVYSTHEKTLKVLDMIHYNIERLRFAEINPSANLSYDVIFEMPKDEEVNE